METEEIKAMRLEAFLNRAYKLDRRIQRPSKGEYYMLTRAENKGEFSKQLKVLKDRIEKVIDIFLKQEINNQTYEALIMLLSLNAQAKNSNDVAAVIEKGLEITVQFK